MTTTDLELDLDPNFDDVTSRAMRNFGIDPILDLLRPSTCSRSMASNRLYVRRWAVRRQRPGESWPSTDHLHLIDEELARMGASAEEAKGCMCYSCVVCNPPTCSRCGGIACS